MALPAQPSPWPLIQLRHVNKGVAALAFEACAGLDPEGVETPLGAALAGDCYQLTSDTGQLTYSASVQQCGHLYWVHAAAGDGRGMTEAGLSTIEHQAHLFGCQLVGFQTTRRGLIRKARARGYLVTQRLGRGVRMEKVI